MESRKAHNLENGGSNPSPAITLPVVEPAESITADEQLNKTFRRIQNAELRTNTCRTWH